MKLKGIVSFAAAATVAVSALPQTFAEGGTDFGKVTVMNDGSRLLNFGTDSITVKGNKGEIINDSDNGDVLRPDNLRTDSDGLAVLTLPAVDLSGTDYNRIEIYAANENNSSISVKAGDTEIAVFDSIYTGGWTNYSMFNTDLITNNASGNITLNIKTDDGNVYCGNYIYVRIFDAGSGENLPVYQDTSRSFEERAADLVSRMTLEEKVSQIGYRAAAIERLGVSEYNYWREALHGVARQGKATSFPSPLSMSNTWNRELIYKIADITSTEARAKNPVTDLSYWSPTVNMARDPRWGRNEETFGEDPYLTGELASEFVNGMQGDDERYLKTISTLKHFAANNNERNRRGGTSVLSEFNLRNYYTKVFQNVVEKAHPASVMSSYNATTVYRNGEILYNYLPSSANSYLLTDLLRRNWGFDGYVTSDCGAGEDMINNSAYKQGMLGSADVSDAQAIAQPFLAGMDLECYLGGGCAATTNGVEMVKQGYISEQELETNVYNLFLQRFRTGEFDEDVSYTEITKDQLETDAHVAAAETAAEESWVLLKNDDSILPLSSDDQNIVIVGSYAGEVVLGDYSGEPEKTVTPYDGLKQELAKTNPSAVLSYLGSVVEDADIMNIKSITLVKSSGSRTSIDLSKAENVSGMSLENGMLQDITPNASAVFRNVDLNDVVTVEAELSTDNGSLGGSIVINYGSANGPSVALIEGESTSGADSFKTFTGAYTGADGGYGGVADIYISVDPIEKEFSVENYKQQLDAADVIIAYAGTTTADSKESNDRASIALPEHQSHVQAIADAYPDKTIVAMQTVGQIDVEPFADKVKAILWTSYNGQTQGTAFGKVLTGQVNPSGRLSTTWYASSDLSKLELANTTKKTLGDITGYYTNYDLQSTESSPGRTYQYYTGSPVYPFGYGISYTDFEYTDFKVSSNSADASGTVKASINVENIGDTAGMEVVQLYVSHPKAGEGNIPEKQLKGFEKILLEPGETKTVEFELDFSDMSLFDESLQKLIVPEGAYKLYIGKNVDDNALSGVVNVTGSLKSELKTVRAIPDGISLKGYICEDGTDLTSLNTINAELSAVMSDEQTVDLENTAVKYSSSDTSIATVDENGTVRPSSKEGTAVITAEVTVDGITKSDSFPVVTVLEIKPDDEEKNAAKAEIESVYNTLPLNAYSEINRQKLDAIYSDALSAVDNALTKTELEQLLEKYIAELELVEMDALEVGYRIGSENPEYIYNGVIDYREGGIEPFSGAIGTVRVDNPYTGIQLKAYNSEGDEVQGVKWQLKKLDGSSRQVADIDSETGKLTVYGNGIVQITAADTESGICGRQIVYVNMQIEAEYADDGDGADLNDIQSGASGGNAGSTSSSWMMYKSVKLTELESLFIRYAGKNAGSIYISTDKSSEKDKLIASVSVPSTGGWSTWTETETELNRDNIYALSESGALDEYGCVDLYIQTNGINLDYFRLNYYENNDEQPYVIEKVSGMSDGSISVQLGWRGSGAAQKASIISAVYNDIGTVERTYITDVSGAGVYEVMTEAKDGENIKVFIWSGMGTMKALGSSYSYCFKTPEPSRIVVYTLGSSEYDYTVLSGGNDGDAYPAVNGLSGYGGWVISDKGAVYEYTDINDNVYPYEFTASWQAGTGGETKRCLYFTPESRCKITVVFNGAEGRDMYIAQGGEKLATGYGSGADVSFSAETDNTTQPVYIYGGSSNKNLYAIIVEYYGMQTEMQNTEQAEPVVLQETEWLDTTIKLIRNPDGKTEIVKALSGDMSVSLDSSVFYEADKNYSGEELKINSFVEYNGRLYAGCDNGYVIVFTECERCSRLIKLCEYDIKEMVIENGRLLLRGKDKELSYALSDIGADDITAEEAQVMRSGGALVIDVRSEEEYTESSATDTVNIPLDNLADVLQSTDRGTAIIFVCASGSRAADAVSIARDMGFERVFNLGSYENII